MKRSILKKRKRSSMLMLVPLILCLCGCDETEPYGKNEFSPVKLEFEGISVEEAGSPMYLKSSVPREGGEINICGVEGDRNSEFSYICEVEDYVKSQSYMPPSYFRREPPYWGSDSWLSGEWWKVTYLKETPPYKIRLTIQPNPTSEERHLVLVFGTATEITKLSLIQQAAMK